jgi:hypothetical protein
MKPIFFIFFIFLFFSFINFPFLAQKTEAQGSITHNANFIRIQKIKTSDEIQDISININNYIAITTASNLELWKLNNESNYITTYPSGNGLAIWSHSGKWFYDGQYIWNAQIWKKVFSLDSEYGDWSEDETQFISCNYNHITLWNTSHWTVKSILRTNFETRVDWLSNNSIILSSMKNLSIYNINNWNIVKKIDTKPSSAATMNIRTSIESGRKNIAFTSYEFSAKIFNLDTGLINYSLYGHGDRITDIDFSPLNDSIISCSEDREIKIWWKSHISENDVNYIHTSNPIRACQWSPNGQFIIIASDGGIVEVCKKTTNTILAIAGEDQTIELNTNIALDGSGSIGNISESNFIWTISDINNSITTLIGETVWMSFNELGLFHVVLNISDGIINDSDEINITVIPISNPPIVTITYPLNKETITNSITILGTASDDILVKSVLIKINNGAWLLCSGTTSWSYFFNINDFPSRGYELSAISFDGIHYSEEARIVFSVKKTISPSNLIPTINITSPMDKDEVKGIIWINGTATDDTIVASVSVTFGPTTILAEGSSNWFSSWDTKLLHDGWWVVRGECTDDQDALSKAFIITIFVNNTGVINKYITNNKEPIIQISYPKDNTMINQSETIFGNTFDDNGIKLVQISINGGIWIDANGLNNWSYNMIYRNCNNTNVSISVRAFDGQLFGYDNITVSIKKEKDRKSVV